MSENTSYVYMGWGVALESMKEGSQVLHVYPYESLPFFEGELTSTTVKVDSKGKELSGMEYVIPINLSMGVAATWKKIDNHVVPPTVVKGERVELWCIRGSEKYYWSSAGMDQHLRRTELAIYAWMATGSQPGADTKRSLEHMYHAIVDTKAGFIKFQTTMKNNEKAGWTVLANGKEGTFVASDQKGNLVRINSLSNECIMINADGSTMTIAGRGGRVFAPDKMVYESNLHEFLGDTMFQNRVHAAEEITSDVDVMAVDVSLIEHGHIANMGVLSAKAWPTVLQLPDHTGFNMAVGG